MLMRVQAQPYCEAVLVNGSIFKTEAFKMQLSAVQPPSIPKGAAQQTEPPTMPLKTASPSSHWVPHHYIGGHVPGWRGQTRRGQARKCLPKRPLWWAWPLAGTTSSPDRGNKYSKVSLSAKAVAEALYFPASPHKHIDFRGQIPHHAVCGVVNFCHKMSARGA